MSSNVVAKDELAEGILHLCRKCGEEVHQKLKEEELAEEHTDGTEADDGNDDSEDDKAPVSTGGAPATASSSAPAGASANIAQHVPVRPPGSGKERWTTTAAFFHFFF